MTPHIWGVTVMKTHISIVINFIHKSPFSIHNPSPYALWTNVLSLSPAYTEQGALPPPPVGENRHSGRLVHILLGICI